MSKQKFMYLISGTIFIILGVVLFLYHQVAIVRISVLMGGLISLNGLWLLISALLPLKTKRASKQRVIVFLEAILTIGLGLWVLSRSQVMAKWLILGIGIYQMVIGVVTLISYYLMRIDQAKGRLSQLMIGLVNLFWGIGSLLTANDPSVGSAIQRLAIYLIFIGMTIFLDGKDYFLTEPIKNNLKRRVRIPVPVIFNVFAPKKMLDTINQFIKNELTMDEFPIEQMKAHIGEPVLKVFIHVGDTGTGTMGHVDLSYKGKVYAYGNYDLDSERLFGSIGDGIFFTLNEEDYIEYCLYDEKTIFEFQVILSNEQQREFEDKLAELQPIMYRWEPTTERQINSYIGQMVKRYHAQLYKFLSSRFKTYFVLGTNCVLLADYLIGTSGLDLIAMVGIMTPGTYYEYFEEELKKPHSIVVGKTVHHAELIHLKQNRFH